MSVGLGAGDERVLLQSAEEGVVAGEGCGFRQGVTRMRRQRQLVDGARGVVVDGQLIVAPDDLCVACVGFALDPAGGAPPQPARRSRGQGRIGASLVILSLIPSFALDELTVCPARAQFEVRARS